MQKAYSTPADLPPLAHALQNDFGPQHRPSLLFSLSATFLKFLTQPFPSLPPHTSVVLAPRRSHSVYQQGSVRGSQSAPVFLSPHAQRASKKILQGPEQRRDQDKSHGWPWAEGQGSKSVF